MGSSEGKADVGRLQQGLKERKGWDSNPRGSVNPLAVFKTAALNHSATLPSNKFRRLQAFAEERIEKIWTRCHPIATRLAPVRTQSVLGTFANMFCTAWAARSSVFENRWPYTANVIAAEP